MADREMMESREIEVPRGHQALAALLVHQEFLAFPEDLVSKVQRVIQVFLDRVEREETPERMDALATQEDLEDLYVVILHRTRKY